MSARSVHSLEYGFQPALSRRRSSGVVRYRQHPYATCFRLVRVDDAAFWGEVARVEIPDQLSFLGTCLAHQFVDQGMLGADGDPVVVAHTKQIQKHAGASLGSTES